MGSQHPHPDHTLACCALPEAKRADVGDVSTATDRSARKARRRGRMVSSRRGLAGGRAVESRRGGVSAEVAVGTSTAGVVMRLQSSVSVPPTARYGGTHCWQPSSDPNGAVGVASGSLQAATGGARDHGHRNLTTSAQHHLPPHRDRSEKDASRPDRHQSASRSPSGNPPAGCTRPDARRAPSSETSACRCPDTGLCEAKVKSYISCVQAAQAPHTTRAYRYAIPIRMGAKKGSRYHRY
jgi:hypothetical protein